MLEEILKEIDNLKKKQNDIQKKIEKLEDNLEEAPALVDLEGQLDFLIDEKLLKLYNLEDELYYKIQNLYSIIYNNSYLDANIMGDAIAKLLTQKEGKEYIHITPTLLTKSKNQHQIRIIVPKENKIKEMNSLPKGTIVLDNNINGTNLNQKIHFTSSIKNENITCPPTQNLYLNLNNPINGKFRDNYIDIPALSLDHYLIIKDFVASIIEYKLDNNKESLSVEKVETLLSTKLETQKKLILSKK